VPFHQMILLAAAATAPAFAYLAPKGDVWQVWLVEAGGSARMITRDASDKIHLSAASGSGELLAVTRDGRGLIIDRSGSLRETLDLGLDVNEAALSADATLVAMARDMRSGPTRERQIWLLDRRDGARRRVVQHGGLQRSPEFSVDGEWLIYTAGLAGGAQELWRVRLDGSAEEQLTAGSGTFMDPSVAPDGSVFVSANRSGDYDIWRVDGRTYEITPAVSRPGPDGQPAASADGRQILFVARGADGSAVWVAEADGSSPRQLTPGGGEARSPVWLAGRSRRSDLAPASMAVDDSAAGDRIAFLKVTDGTWQPWEIRPDGTGLRRIATLAQDISRITASADGRRLLANSLDGTLHLLDSGAANPKVIAVEPPGTTDAALSPDGTQIVFSVNTLESIDANDLWLVSAGGGKARRLTDQPFLQHFPVWATSGEILYLSGRGGQTHDIWSVDAGNGKARAVVGEGLYNFEPAVSARGDIAFSSNRGGDYDIWLLKQGASTPERVTTEPGYDGQPAFSPDGRSLVHVSRRGGAARLVVRPLDGGQVDGGQARELPLDSDARLPIWHSGGTLTVASVAGLGAQR